MQHQISAHKKRVLVAPLDWGLGHSARCVPIVHELQRQGAEVILAGSGDSLALIANEFPLLPTAVLPAYAPRYPLKGSMAAAMMRQMPHFVRTILAEHRAVKELVSENNIDVVISDNRYGCWTSRCPSVFITHQMSILMPRRFGFLGGAVRRVSDRLIANFDLCWIPDSKDHSLAGVMAAHPAGLNIRHIGWLSRLKKQSGAIEKRYDVLAVFSGPEPQRTEFERIVRQQLIESDLKFMIVRGLPLASEPTGDDRIVNFMTSAELQEALACADVVLARCGYSTVMDLCAVGKKAIFVPTPGQPEQEYLAQRLKDADIAYFASQKHFDLGAAIREGRRYRGFDGVGNNAVLAEAVRELLHLSE